MTADDPAQRAEPTVGSSAAVVDIDTCSGHPFDAFFEAEERQLLRFCAALTLDREEAVEVAQSAMVKALENWDRIGQGNPAGWVRTVSLNLVRNGWRSEQRRQRAVTRMGSSATAHDPEPTSPEVLEALAGLSDRQREAVVLHHMVDLPVAEVAREMGVSEASVKTHLQRGRASLASALDEGLGGGSSE